MIDLTEKAAGEVKRLVASQDVAGLKLRIGVAGGGCSGLSYSLNFDTVVGEEDQVFEINGVELVCDMKSLLYLTGTTIDYVETLTGGGFRFENPNAAKSCGCGSSFAV